MKTICGFAVASFLCTALGAGAARAQTVQVGHVRIVVTSEVVMFPGKGEDLAKLPGPLASLDPKADFEAGLVRQLAYERAAADARRKVADRMAAELKDRSRWVLREMNWPETLPEGDPAKFTVTAVFERSDTPAAVPDDAARKAQGEMNKLFGKVRVVVAYDFGGDPPAAARPFIERVNGELIRGAWSQSPHMIMKKGEDPSDLAARVKDGADLIFRIAVNEQTNGLDTDVGKFFKSVGSLSLTVYHRSPDGRWPAIHQATLANGPDDRSRTGNETQFFIGGQFTAADASGKLYEKMGKGLLDSGQLFDACNRTFAGLYKSEK